MSDTLWLCLVGDVMVGRGIDQVLPHPSDPHLQEAYVVSARQYVELAERANGPIPEPANFSYVWGDALPDLRSPGLHARIVNLETSITRSANYVPKGINYRLNPGNIDCLLAADINCCVIANNHVMDFGVVGLLETLEILDEARILHPGAGVDKESAAKAAVIRVTEARRVLVFGFGCGSSGIPAWWAANPRRPGVNFLVDLTNERLAEIGARVYAERRPGDVLVASIHWGGNWGYEIPPEQIAFARGLIEIAGFDVVHGHSSHHPKAIEIFRRRPILYGSGDFINDYEGIRGYGEFRGDLVLMYLLCIDMATGEVVDVRMLPFRIKQFRLQRTSLPESIWLGETLRLQCNRFATHIALEADNSFRVLL